jgi:hypothetical protein
MNILKPSLYALLTAIICVTVISAGCAEKTFTPPYTTYATMSQKLGLYQLEMAYYKDATAADAAYSGKRYDFGLIQADIANRGVFDVHESEDYVLAGNVKFKPRATADMKGIIQGTVVQVIGDVEGVISGYIVVDHCWFSVESGGAASSGGGAY